MDGAAHAVAELRVKLGKLIAGIHAGFRDISHSSGLNDVPDDELLDSLILGHTLGAVGATDGLDMATPVLVATVISALGGHSEGKDYLLKI